MEAELERRGCSVRALDFRLDDSELDQMIGYPPYPSRHYKLTIGDFVSTSFGLIIERGQ